MPNSIIETGMPAKRKVICLGAIKDPCSMRAPKGSLDHFEYTYILYISRCKESGPMASGAACT